MIVIWFLNKIVRRKNKKTFLSDQSSSKDWTLDNNPLLDLWYCYSNTFPLISWTLGPNVWNIVKCVKQDKSEIYWFSSGYWDKETKTGEYWTLNWIHHHRYTFCLRSVCFKQSNYIKCHLKISITFYYRLYIHYKCYNIKCVIIFLLIYL